MSTASWSAYETATLTGTNRYGLDHSASGVYGSTVSAHSAERCSAGWTMPSGRSTCRSTRSPISARRSFEVSVLHIYGGGSAHLPASRAYVIIRPAPAVFVCPPTGVSFSVGTEQQRMAVLDLVRHRGLDASPDPLFRPCMTFNIGCTRVRAPGELAWRPDTTSSDISPLQRIPPMTSRSARCGPRGRSIPVGRR